MIEEMEENNPKGISGTSEFEMIEETEENKSRGRSEAQWPALWRFGSCRREGINWTTNYFLEIFSLKAITISFTEKIQSKYWKREGTNNIAQRDNEEERWHIGDAAAAEKTAQLRKVESQVIL